MTQIRISLIILFSFVFNESMSQERVVFSSMEKALKNPEKVYLLQLNGLSDIPKEIGKLINLEQLNIYNCKITSLPKEIGKLKNLNRLILSNNKLIQLPNEFINLSNLNDLRSFKK